MAGQKHKRRGIKGTALAAAAMAALTASQSPGTVAQASAPAKEAPAEHGPSVSGDAPYRTELPPLRTRKRAGRASVDDSMRAALPASVFAAYRQAEAELARTTPACNLRWQLLAAIGQVESGQARGGRVTEDGTTRGRILGPRLDGHGFAVLRDSDGGAYDGDGAYDRAVGPMQFIPSTWATWGADGNGDGRTDPNNVYDAALAAGRYLCAGGRDLSEPGDLDRAILGYNHSAAYLRTVRAWFAYFLEGHQVVPDALTAVGTSPEPEASHRPRPKASHSSPTGPAGPSGDTSRTPSSPTPSPTPSKARPTGGTEEPDEPALPLPRPSVELPGGGVLPSDDPLVGNGKDSMTAAPSTTASTGR